ncbi:hypothetical protein TNCV_2776301 [Trichonephila clavipes]|nr:hypothetical protein TNCV_2776301 [Trichonephila clavipes]
MPEILYHVPLMARVPLVRHPCSKLSPKPKNSNFFAQMKNHSHASRIPSFNQSPSCHSAEWKPPLSPCPTSKTSPDMGLRTVLQSRCPKENTYSIMG